MPRTVRARKNPTSRIETGDGILVAGRTVATAAIKSDLAAFARVHADYRSAETKVRAAADKKRAKEEEVGELNVTMDRCVASLGAQLAADGLPKSNPFAALDAKPKFPPPSTIQSIGYADEAKIAHRLHGAVKKREDLGRGSLAASAALDKAASAVESALSLVPALAAAHAAALTGRETIAQSWETALATLKAACRYADKKNGTRLYAALFQSAAAPARKPRAAPAKRPPAAPDVPA